MQEFIQARGSSKEELYNSLLAPIQDLLGSETDYIANMANLCSVLKETFHFYWVGFYIVRNNELVLGPFQGGLACTRIGYGKGVCGTSWKEGRAILVEDVDQFPGHIACSSYSKSEIVIPLKKQNEVWAVLDIDSDKFAHFDSVDEKYLSQIIGYISTSI